MATRMNPEELDIQEQLARIRKTQADIDKMFDERAKIQTEIKIIPWTLFVQATLAAAALLGAGAAIAKLI